MCRFFGIDHLLLHVNTSGLVLRNTRANEETLFTRYSGTSLLRSPTGLCKSDLNGDVTVLQGVICTVEDNLGLNKGDRNGEVTLLMR